MRRVWAMLAFGALAACTTDPMAPVEEFVIPDPGGDIELTAPPVIVAETAPVPEPAPVVVAEPVPAPAPVPDEGDVAVQNNRPEPIRAPGCPAGAGVLYGGTQYCVQGYF